MRSSGGIYFSEEGSVTSFTHFSIEAAAGESSVQYSSFASAAFSGSFSSSETIVSSSEGAAVSEAAVVVVVVISAATVVVAVVVVVSAVVVDVVAASADGFCSLFPQPVTPSDKHKAAAIAIILFFIFLPP